MNFITRLVTTALVLPMSLGGVPAEANQLIQADNGTTDSKLAKIRTFINNPIDPQFNHPRNGGETTLVTKCEARRHFQGKGYFLKTKKMSAQIMIEHPVGGLALNRNEICEHVLRAAGK